jgi:hypothetical protein
MDAGVSKGRSRGAELGPRAWWEWNVGQVVVVVWCCGEGEEKESITVSARSTRRINLELIWQIACTPGGGRVVSDLSSPHGFFFELAF